MFVSVWACLVACSKDNDDSPSGASSLQLTVAGKSWTANSGIIIGTSVTDGKNNLTITGTNNNFEGQTSTFAAILSSATELTTGSYRLSNFDGTASITKVNGKTYIMGSSSFTIQITEVQGTGTSKKFRGTFSGTLKGPAAGDDAIVTNGVFSSF